MDTLALFGIISISIIIIFSIMIIIITFMRKKILKLKKENSNLYESIDRLNANLEIIEKYNIELKNIDKKRGEYEKNIKSAKTKEDRDNNMDMLNSLNSKL